MRDIERTDNRQISKAASVLFAAACLVSAGVWYAGEATAGRSPVSGTIEADAGNAMPSFRPSRDYGEIVR